MSDLLIERMRKAVRTLDGYAHDAREYETDVYLEMSDYRELFEQAIKRIETMRVLVAASTNHLLKTLT